MVSARSAACGSSGIGGEDGGLEDDMLKYRGYVENANEAECVDGGGQFVVLGR